MDKITVLTPCYNDEKTIEKVVKDFKTALPETIIYAYNNNSKNRTAEFAEASDAIVCYGYIQSNRLYKF